MKPSLGLASVVILSLLVSAIQDSGKPKIPDADLRKLSDSFCAMALADSKKPDPDLKKAEAEQKKRKQAKDDFTKEYERIDKSVKPAVLLSMADVWTEVFYSCRTLPKAPSGLGRVEDKTLAETYNGKPVEFHYGLILPSTFDVKKRYPLIIALHDKAAKEDKVSGPRYLEEVWMKLPKEERDKFIIIAPTMGSGAAGKDHRVEFGDLLHIWSVYLPLKELLAKYPVDNDRIYLDGTGEGGEFALHLALYKPQVWAAVAVRSALPRTLQLLENGGSLPISVNFRIGTPVQTGPAREAFDQKYKALGIPLEVREYPAAEKPARTPFNSDVILEATTDIVTFYGQKARTVAPKKLTFVTDTALFKECYWARLDKHETGDHFAKITGTVDEAGNSIDIKTDGVEIFRIYLSDRLLNLDRPVKVSVNGQPHTERLFTRSLDTFLNYYKSNPFDPSLQPTAVLQVEVARATESKPESQPAPK